MEATWGKVVTKTQLHNTPDLTRQAGGRIVANQLCQQKQKLIINTKNWVMLVPLPIIEQPGLIPNTKSERPHSLTRIVMRDSSPGRSR